MNKQENRRQFIGKLTLLTGGFLFGMPQLKVFAESDGFDKGDSQRILGSQRYKIAVVDLMILKRQKLGAIALTKEIGADGLELDMGGLGNRDTFHNKLADPEVRQQFIDKARELNLEICSLAMTGFYAQSLATRPTYQRMIADCIATMRAMKVKVAFLPLGVQGDLAKNPELRPILVERLKVVGKMAKEAGVVIGIETALDASGELQLLREIGSSAIKSYFNFSNALKHGRDLHQELRILGRKHIVQIHCTNEDGVWLQNDAKVDMKAIKKTMDDMGWKGWLVIERSRDAAQPTNVRSNFTANTVYLKSVFQ